MLKKVTLITLVAILLIAAASVSAVTDGQPDGEAHPYVGLLVFDVNGQPAWRCTGTLISPTVVLTAGHCTFGATGARIWFDTDLTNNPEYPFGGTTSIEGTPISHPAYDDFATFPNTSDVGVVVLTEAAVNDRGFGAVAGIGTLDSLATQRGQQDVNFEVVGYGLQSVKPNLSALRIRYKGRVQLVNLRSALNDGWNVQHTGDPGKGNGPGGTCFGDSGGPVFYPEGSNVIVAVTSFGLNQNCKGVGFAYRVDTQHAQSFIFSH